jgi:hypothetical protein
MHKLPLPDAWVLCLSLWLESFPRLQAVVGLQSPALFVHNKCMTGPAMQAAVCAHPSGDGVFVHSVMHKTLVHTALGSAVFYLTLFLFEAL